MNKLIFFSILSLAIFTSGSAFAQTQSSTDEQDQMMNMMKDNNMMNSTSSNMMMENNNMMSMMDQIPQDVIIQIVSPQKIQTGKQAEIILQIFDKNSGEPLNDATVTVGIEKGAAMTSMNMAVPMIDAKNIGNGKYLVTFTPEDEMYYTMHTHVIPPGKSMHSMMQNHMNMGLISEKIT